MRTWERERDPHCRRADDGHAHERERQRPPPAGSARRRKDLRENPIVLGDIENGLRGWSNRG
jgi:hypothetical protein